MVLEANLTTPSHNATMQVLRKFVLESVEPVTFRFKNTAFFISFFQILFQEELCYEFCSRKVMNALKNIITSYKCLTTKKISKALGFRGSQCVKEIMCQHLTYFMDLSMLIIDNGHELNRILDSTDLDEHKLIDLPMEQ